MGKNNKSAAKAAAEKVAAEQAAPETKAPVNVIQLGDLKALDDAMRNGNMDLNHAMDMIRVQHETFRMDPKAAERTGMSQEAIDQINKINAAEQVIIMAANAMFGTNPFAVMMRQTQLEAIKEVGLKLGINIDTKALPAPDANGNITLPSEAIKVTEEAKEGLKEEQEAAKRQVVLDPTKVENEQQLKDSLLSILVKGKDSTNFYDKVATAINFYESYMSIQATKAEDKEARLTALKEKSRADFLADIAKLLGKCPFTASGMAKILFEQVQKTKNPVVSFCMMRSASLNKKTDVPLIDDTLVADIVKVLIRWYADSRIQSINDGIAGIKKNLEVLKKDEKKNKKAIEDQNNNIEKSKNEIAAIEEVVGYTNIPSREIVDSFQEDYKDSKREGYVGARMMGAKILENYYPGTKSKEVEEENLLHNLHQRIGLIFNMFLPPLQQLIEFSESNLTDLVKIEAPAEENKPEEKNA